MARRAPKSSPPASQPDGPGRGSWTSSCSSCSSSRFSPPRGDSRPSVQLSEGRVELRKQINLFSCVSIIIGIIIGSGIFVSPVGILINVRSVGMSCVMWAVCGVYSLLCALCFAELGATFPESGGEYLYIMRAFGDFPAFLCLWINFIVINPVGQAASTLIFATYLLRPVYPECPPPPAALRIIAALIMALLISINCINVNWSTKIQGTTTASKLIALVTVIVIGFIWMINGRLENFQNAFEGSDYSGGAIALAFYSGFWAFGGWYLGFLFHVCRNSLNFLTAEVINPHRNMPLATTISMVIVTVVYLTANIAYFAVLTPSEILQSSAVAVTFSERTVTVLSYIMPVLIAISVAGGINGYVLSVSRLFFVGARHNHLPRIISMITIKNLTPAPALISVFVLTLLMQNFGEIFFLIEMMGFGFAVVVTTVLAGFIKIRLYEPDLPRPIKLPLLIPACLLVTSVAILLLTLYRKPRESGICVIFIATGLPFYVLGTRWKKTPGIRAALDGITLFLQKLMMVMPEERPSTPQSESEELPKADITSPD